jgi:AcrR family transcriptional regulator
MSANRDSAGRRIDLARRAEIGAEKRVRTRAAILAVARRLFGREGGQTTRIEDVCEAASMARGTFYNYFSGIDALQAALFEDLSRDFDQAVHAAFAGMGSAAERTCAAIRYYLGHAVDDPHWGWGMVNTGMGTGLFPAEVAARVQETIQEGIDAGEFSIGSALAGRDILLGASLAATITLLKGRAPRDYSEAIAAHVLTAMGVATGPAGELARRPLASLNLLAADAR